jgi:hypothetical protein
MRRTLREGLMVVEGIVVSLPLRIASRGFSYLSADESNLNNILSH